MLRTNKKIVILDLDGTVADCTHRIHFIKDGRRDYDAFYDNMDKDEPIQSVIDLVQALYDSCRYRIYAVSGRPMTHIRQTEDWLRINKVPHHKIMMRPAGDYRKDTIIKKEILDEIRKENVEIAFALDDRQSVVDMWRDNGVKCLQVAPGDFDEKQGSKTPGKLIMLVGPSGAGKSTYAVKLLDEEYREIFNNFKQIIVASDSIREQFCDGNFQDQSRNEEVFVALRNIVKARIESGLLTVVDATNLRNKDRKFLLDAVPENTVIEYHVINRSVEEKKKTGGWRLDVSNKGVNLIDRHEQIFNSNLKDILKGDGDKRVKVIDTRKKT